MSHSEAKYLNYKETVEFLNAAGMRVSLNALRLRVSRKRIPYQKRSDGRVYFSVAELNTWLYGTPVKPNTRAIIARRERQRRIEAIRRAVNQRFGGNDGR